MSNNLIINSVINKTIEACKGSNYNVLDHFAGAGKMVEIGASTSRKIGFGPEGTCYLGQTYFNTQN